MFQQLLNEFQTIKHERHDTASGSRGKLTLSGDKAKPYLKLQFPRFSGGDPAGWLYQASQFFEFQSVAPEEQVDVASMHPDGIALQWHRWFTKLKGPVTWAEFSQALLARFGPTDYENPAEALSRLNIRQRPSVSPPLLYRPHTRTDSAGILGPSPTTTLALPSPPTRRISNTEAKGRCEKGLCYYCDEKYLPDTTPATESAVADYSETQAEVSFHAITGTIHPQTLRMPGKIKNKDVVVLIDGGYRILTDFWVLPVSACLVVLGVQWLQTLGPVEIDYQKLTFGFKLAGVTHTLQGLKATELQAIPTNELVALQGLAYFLQIEPLGVHKPTGSVPCLAIQRLLQRPCGVLPEVYQKLWTIAAPLHKLVGKSAFSWDSVAETAFQQLKRALTTTPTLGLPDWSKSFTVECDASGVGIGAILTQQGQPIAYYSAPLKGSMLAWSTYEKEMLAIVKAVRKWKSYLLGRPFVVKTDHISLKYLLDQRVSTPAQARWLPKLMGYDFRVEYKRGVTNIRADALSRQPEFSFLAISHVTAGWWAELQQEVKQDTYYHNLPEGFPIKFSYDRQRIYVTHCQVAWNSFHDKFSYNTSVNSASKMTPFEAVYGRPPPRVLTYVSGTSKVQAVEEFLIDRDKVLHDLRSNLLAANDPSAIQAATVAVRLSAKIGPKFFGPYKILERVGPVAYRLELPPEALIHNVFHVSLLKPCRGDPPTPLASDENPAPLPSPGPQPEVVLEERVVKKGKYRPKVEILVKWQGFPREDATWETKWRFQRAYPDFRLEDKAISSGGD
uniref:Transposon Ty3-G Gag-Pol polyprotein n=1 Tax=Tanacetum cinerariifolium TaxID=118510 RepID=A0A6L2JTP6_TANCI|nr:transposon Ty3-G Gag-Pol polyprotein [Tanacetum cinerariifolium]